MPTQEATGEIEGLELDQDEYGCAAQMIWAEAILSSQT